MPLENSKISLDSLHPHIVSTPAEVELKRLREIEAAAKDLLDEVVTRQVNLTTLNKLGELLAPPIDVDQMKLI